MNYQPDPIDLLILDEVESIFEQFNSGLHKKFNVNFAIFKWMISTAKYVICMDANISDRTYNTLKNLRPNHSIFFHWNTFKRAANDKYYKINTKIRKLSFIALKLVHRKRINTSQTYILIGQN